MLLSVEPLLYRALELLWSRKGLDIEAFCQAHEEFRPELSELLPSLILMPLDRRLRALEEGCLQVACEFEALDHARTK